MIGPATFAATLARSTFALALLAPAAHAGAFDLTGFITRDGGSYTLDEPALVASLESIVTSLRPAFGSTGGTTGARGMALELAWSWTPVDSWAACAGCETPDGLTALHIEARKGLPAGFELAAAVSHSSTLDMTQASFALRWAWLEGDGGSPDIGMRLDGGAILGHPQTSLFAVGLELIVGYPVAVAGLFELAPYGGFAFRFARSIDRRVGTLDGVSPDPFIANIPGQNVFLNHAVIGLRVSARPLDVGLEAVLGTTVGLTIQLGAKL